MNIQSIDLNLLVVFGALCEERNTSKVAHRLGLSQPAVSHALARLRGQLGDPLFVRAARGLTPTPRALELHAPVADLLARLGDILQSPREFTPASATTTFRIASTDYFEQVALPYILKIIERDAPGVSILFRPTLGQLPKAELENGDYDLAIAGFYGKMPEGFFKQKVFDDDFVCVTKRDHPRIRGKNLTVAAYAAEKHILISPKGDMQSKSRDLLEKKGLRQDFRVGVASFLSPGMILTTTELVLTCPRKLANSYAQYLPLTIHELPIDIPNIQVMQVWHGRSQRDPAHTWIRQLIHRVCRELK